MRIEFNDDREALTIAHVKRVVSDLQAERVTFEHRGGATSYNDSEIAGWGIDAASDCGTCNDTGYVCVNCDQADGECTCDGGPELGRCGDCGGPDLSD